MDVREVLLNEGFEATHTFTSARGDFFVAIDGFGNAAFGEVYAGRPFVPKVAALTDITVEARDKVRGVLVLRIGHAGKHYDVSFSQRVSEDYEQRRQQLSWWREALQPRDVSTMEVPEQLALQDFHAVHWFVSIRGDAVVAIDCNGQVAIGAVDAGAIGLVSIRSQAAMSVAVRSDTVLHISHGHRAYSIQFRDSNELAWWDKMLDGASADELAQLAGATLPVARVVKR